MHHSPEDIEVIQQVLQGNKDAYSILVRRYEQYVFTLVLRMINNREQAEELAQDVFVKAYRMLQGYRSEAKFSTWLYTIVNTTCLSYLRKKKDHLILLEQEQLVAVSEYNTQVAENSVEQKTEKELLQAAIKQLSPTDAQAITLFYLAEQSLQEIAEITDQPITNVKVRLFRARQKLKEILGKKYSNEI